MEEKKKEIRISVRNLVEFILRSGDLDNSSGGFGERDAMQAGTRVHQQIQKKRGADYRAEVPLVHEKEYEHFILRVEGRADGMYEDGTTTVIEEIKGTYRDLETMEEPVPVHLAQAKCYAYIYGFQNRKEEMGVLMTYTLLSSEEEGLLRPLTKEEVKPEHSNWRIRHFLQTYKLPELEQWFDELLDAWFIWAEFQYQWQKARDASMQHLEFPFPYRKGQRELVSGVYRTILRKKELFVQAPTGIGKTMSTVFPAIRAIGEGCGDRLFYLTAKTITRTVAVDSARQSTDHRHAVCRQHLREKGRLALSVRRTYPRAHNRRCFLLIRRQRAPHEKAGRHVRERHKPLRIALLPAADCKDFHRHTSDPPYTFVGAPKADRLTDMRHADFDRPVQIRNCPRGADNPVVGTRAEAQAAEGIL